MPKLERSLTRQQIDDILENPKFTKIDEAYDTVGTLTGLAVLERNLSDIYKCAEFVFLTVMKEGWDEGRGKIPDKLWHDTLNFLGLHDYEVVEEPQEGDIVGYACESLYETYPSDDATFLALARQETKRKPPYFQHFGVYRNGKVVSKFNEGFIYEHYLDMVPNSFGTFVFFFRKNASNT